MARKGETEVFRLTPQVGKVYETATFTRMSYDPVSKKERYFTSRPMQYMGEFKRTERNGYCDGSKVWSIFVNQGVERMVEYTYEGTTCFIEVEPFHYFLR
jgi:hypothetical protein